jgi:hypothetical protein
MRSRSLEVVKTTCQIAATAAALGISLLEPFAGPARASVVPVREENDTPGERIVPEERRPSAAAWPRTCSLSRPLCVHAAPAAGADAIAALGALERAWDVLTGALALPAPDADSVTRAVDVYLTDAPGSEAHVATRDPIAHVDRASAWLRLDARARGCGLEHEATRAIARASQLRAAPALDPSTAEAQASALARLAVPCAGGLVDGVDTFQAEAARPIADRLPREPATLRRAYPRGAQLFWWWLDAGWGVGPADVIRSTWALAATVTPPIAHRWTAEPDAFDILRSTFKGEPGSGLSVDDVLVDFAVSRAFVGDDERHLGEARGLSGLRPPLTWDVPWPSAPRRLASPTTGVGPTGAAYVRIARSGAAPGARLRVELAWEEHARMRWIAVKTRGGQETARIPIGGQDKGTEAQGTLVDLDGTDAVVLVGVGLGDWTEPFDPEGAEWEPHGWLATIAAE